MERKWLKKRSHIFLLIPLFFILFSCVNSTNERCDETILLKGILSAEDDIKFTQNEKNGSRTAFPEIPTLYYTVEAVKTGSTERYVGVVNNLERTFEIKLNAGEWTLTAKGYCDEEKTKQSFEGMTKVNLEKLQPVVDDITITVKPQKKGNGSVNLTLNIDENCGITTCEAEWKNGETTQTQTLDFSSNTSATFTMNGNGTDISSNSYTVFLKFYNKDKSELLYYCIETVNVFDNLTTDTWVNNGNKLYLSEDTEEKTIFKITNSLIENFKMTSFFVQGTDGSYTPNISSSDSNNGTYFDPLATVAKAAQKSADHSKTTPCYIFIDGIVTEGEITNIEEYSTIIIMAFSPNAEIKKAASINPLISTSGLLTIDNIKTNGNLTYSKGNLTLKGSTTLDTISLDSEGLLITIDELSSESVAKITMKDENELYANIIYKKEDAILKPLDTKTLTQTDCNRFSLTSPYFVLMPNNDGTKGILADSEGKIIPEIKKEVLFTLDKDGEVPKYNRGETITVNAKLTDTNGTSDCTGDMTDWKIVITNHGSNTGTESTKNSVTIPDGSTEIKKWPADTYTVTVSAKYKTEDLVYDASFDIEIAK
ncbi:MAG: hypothetical protein SPE48_01110 [Treponema porcinum]|uniref:hypothetical protein n=2 Tax=Treponema porcinum TaxID=261392 RepID=UPI002A83E788|nr:hypothetical protein [Treponema porcinum]MDY5120491.1 hypothetical protein [Treponema porcinum]